MKLIPLILLAAMLAVSGCSRNNEKYPDGNLLLISELSPELIQKAEAGDAEAQYELGLNYEDKEKVKWFMKSADKGHPGAQHELGLCYELGKVVPKDDEEALKWYKKSADQGNEFAMREVERLTDSMKKAAPSRPIPKPLPFKQRVPFEGEPYSSNLVKKAEAGDAVAQNDLGVCLSDGVGVAQDKKEAVRWFRKAAVNGNALAQSALGTCYFIGSGVEQDKREAVKWFTKSAEQGFSVMQYMVGTCYENGEGVEKDKNEAVKWYTKAKENGIDEDVQRMRRMMEDQSNGK